MCHTAISVEGEDKTKQPSWSTAQIVPHHMARAISQIDTEIPATMCTELICFNDKNEELPTCQVADPVNYDSNGGQWKQVHGHWLVAMCTSECEELLVVYRMRII